MKPVQKRYEVLAAIDYADLSSRVLDQALEIAASKPGGHLDVVFVTSPMVPALAPVELVPGFVSLAARDDELKRLRDHVQAHVARYVGEHGPLPLDRITVHVRLGVAAEEIVALAEDLEADIVVVATHGRKGIVRAVLGSVAEKVVRNATCPVLVVRPKVEPPAIEPACEDCLAHRAATKGAELWCARHSEHHVRAHVYHYTGVDASVSDTGRAYSVPGG